MEKFTIPSERKSVGNNDFKRKLEQRKAENRQDNVERYSDMKYNIIKAALYWVLPASIILLLVSDQCNWLIIKGYCMWYIQVVITLYIGSLIGKDFN